MSKLDTLHPQVKDQALKLQSLAKERFNIIIGFSQALRTEPVQYAFWAKGRLPLAEVNSLLKIAGIGPITQKENRIVTKAKSASTTFHGYGLAFDIVIFLADGRTIVWDNSADTNDDDTTDWDQVGSLAEECGLEWGGNFTSISDKPHYQNRLGFTIAQLKTLGATPGQVLPQSFVDQHQVQAPRSAII